MLENRDLKHDLFALALLAVVAFLTLALATYHAADPVGEVVWPLSVVYAPDPLVYPPADEVANLCGRWGALAADLLLTVFGLGAYYLVLSLAVVNVLLLRRRKIDAPAMRAAGWIVSLVGLTALAAIIVPTMSPGPVIGSGGYLGALGRGILQSHFASWGGGILALSMMAGGVLLCTDYALVRMAVGAYTATVAVVTGRRSVAAGSGQSLQADDLEDATENEDEPENTGVRVRVRGRPLKEPAEDETDGEGAKAGATFDEDKYEDDEDDEEQEDRQPSFTGRRSLLATVRSRLSPRPGRPAGPELAEREEVISRLDAAAEAEESVPYELPSPELLLEADEVSYEEQEKEVRRKAKILEKTFLSFGFKVKVVEIETGPVVAQYEVELEAGLRLSRITGLADDLAIALRVPSVRIVAPIPGKNTVGIEVPNTQRQIVRLREVMEEADGHVHKMRIPVFLGKDVSGSPMVVDLATLPHLLIAGRTGTGKSVCLNAIISSILMTRRPDEVRLLLIDPKMVELSCYRTLPHLMHPVVTDMRKAEAILAWAVEKMEERYSLLAKAGVRHVSIYNQLGEEELMERLAPETDDQRQSIPLHLPYIVIVADEIADLMLTSGKEVEEHIIRLAQKSRAVGIHLVLATQKPTVDVITGLIKSNLPARISFQVASRTDSRVVLDEMGADKLLGSGDMLFLWPGTSMLLRGQGTYVSDDEIGALVDEVSTGEQHFVGELIQLKVKDGRDGRLGKLKSRDELYESAVDVVVREGRGSVSLLQRTLGIGYGRAARLIDYMAEDGIVGPYAGSQAREVLVSPAQWAQMQGDQPEPEPVRRPRSNKIIPVSDWDEDDQAPAETDEADIFDGRAKERALQAADAEQEEPYDEDCEEEEYEEEDEAEESYDEEEQEEDEYEEEPYEAESA